MILTNHQITHFPKIEQENQHAYNNPSKIKRSLNSSTVTNTSKDHKKLKTAGVAYGI